MGVFVMTDPIHHFHRPGPRRTWGYFALHGRAALLIGPLFWRIFLLLYGYYQNLFIFYLSYWLHVLVCGEVDQIQVQGLSIGFVSSIPTFVIFVPIWTIRLCLDRIMLFWYVLILKSLFAAISQSYVSLVLAAPNRSGETPLLVPRLWLFMLRKDSAPSGRASLNILAMNPVCFVFAIG